MTGVQTCALPIYPLECAPLSCWVPRVGKDMVLSTVAEEGEFDSTKVEHSK